MNQETTKMKVTDFITGPVSYDEFRCQYFWINDPKGGQQMLMEMRGWGAIQNMEQFKLQKGVIDIDAAEEYQDKLGNWIAEAINEKLEREKTNE